MRDHGRELQPVNPSHRLFSQPDAVILDYLAAAMGEAVALANGAKAKTLCTLLGDCLAGIDGRDRAPVWSPRWMTFPPAA